LVAGAWQIGYRAPRMQLAVQEGASRSQAFALNRPAAEPVLALSAELSLASRHDLARDDLVAALRNYRLCWVLACLDIKSRYRGSLLGPFWLTLSTAVMVSALGFLYSTLFRTNLHDYLPFLALSLVLWGFVQTLVTECCTAFTSQEGMIRSVAMPFFLYAGRIVLRNLLVLAHNVIVIAVVFAIFAVWPGWAALAALPAALLWLIDGLAVAVALGAFCARFRDVPPIVASVMQIAFFVSPIIWKPELIEHGRRFLPLNPFFSLIEIVRAPLLGALPSWQVWVSAAGYSALICCLSWVLFVRVRGRLAFWL
jgi:lipopolysaccharide transport system permease protein